jgi:hypothetical protein
MAAKAMRLLFELSNLSPSLNAQIWTTLGAAGRAAICNAATSPAQPKLAVQALRLLANLAANSKEIIFQLWNTLDAAQHAALVTVATTTAQPIAAEQALRLLANLAGNSDFVNTSLWKTLGPTGRAAVVAAATNPAQLRVAEQALRLLYQLAGLSEGRKVGLWTSLGAVGRAAVITTGTNLAQPRVAEQALIFLYDLTINSDARQTDLWDSLGADDVRNLIIAATTAEEEGVAGRAISLFIYLKPSVRIRNEIWPVLKPRLAQLWALTKRPYVELQAKDFLLHLLYDNDQRTRDVLDVAITDVSLRHTIAILREWGRLAGQKPKWRIMLQTFIVQAITTPQKMAVLMAAMMSGLNISQRPLEEREALRDQVLAIPMAEGIDPTLFREHMRLGLRAACGNTSAMLDSPVLSAPEKLQLLEILYSSRNFLSAQVTQDELLRMQSTANISLDLKLRAIELILTHGKANSFQFKTILTWLKAEFKRDPQTGELTNRPTVFSNPSTLGDIGDAAIFALTEQRDQYLALYQNFRPHMTRDFIQEEIEHIERRVSGKEMPQDFGAILIHQLRQFLSIDWPMSALEEERMFDRKS